MNDDFTIVLLNARSVIPKLNSLITTMDEMEADVTCVTETWMGDEDDGEINDVQGRTDYSFITRKRGKHKKGGGVAILSLIHI